MFSLVTRIFLNVIYPSGHTGHLVHVSSWPSWLFKHHIWGGIRQHHHQQQQIAICEKSSQLTLNCSDNGNGKGTHEGSPWPSWVLSREWPDIYIKVAQLFHKVAQFVATNVVFKDCNIAQKVGKEVFTKRLGFSNLPIKSQNIFLKENL